MSKVFRMHVLAAEFGDCLWVDYGDAANPHRVLIDAGTPGTFKRLKPALDQVRRAGGPSHQLFIVTHIDADHIGGSIPVLEDPVLAAQFGEVWFNGRHHLLQATKEEAFGAVQGERLTAAIMARKLPWNKRFKGRAVVRGADDMPPSFDLDGGARITVLTPGIEQLRKLLPKWDKEVKKAGLDPVSPDVVHDSTEAEESLGAINVDTLASESSPEDTAEANGSSIATLIEIDGRKLLTGAKLLKVDVFKLPHHGSKANVTKELLDAVDAKVIVFSSNGKLFQHPDQEAVARVIKRYGKGAQLVFNYMTNFNKVWNEKSIRDQWGYRVAYGQGEEGITVMVGTA
jgi:hypothetical protein